MIKKLIIALTLLALPAQASEVAFSPFGGAEALVLRTILSAHKSVHIAAYSFTSKPISYALIEARSRGVDVWVVADESNMSSPHAITATLIRAGIPVHYNGCYKIQHNKFMVIDGRVVQTGSFNYSKAAAKSNSENVIVFDDISIAAEYGAEWQRLWAESSVGGECVR